MEKTKIIEAKEANRLTSENKATIEYCMSAIINQANFGSNECLTIKYVDQDIQRKLMQLGYAISLFTDQIGMTATRISW